MNLETQNYFEGQPEEDITEFHPQDYRNTIEDKDEEELDSLEMDLVEEIDVDIENEFKKKNAQLQDIQPEALPLNVRKAETLHSIHEQQLKIVKETKNGRKKKKGSVLGSFLNF